MLALADVFVWVTDPQKYADARLHDDFVRILGEHEAVTLAVLNQEDRVPPGAVDRIADDLGRLLAQDGIRGAAVLPTSASTGAGMPELTRRLAESVAGHASSRRRLSADVITVARSLREQVGDSEADLDLLSRDDLDAALGRAAGVPVVLDAVDRDYRRQALAASGWPFTRWIAGIRRESAAPPAAGPRPPSGSARSGQDRSGRSGQHRSGQPERRGVRRRRRVGAALAVLHPALLQLRPVLRRPGRPRVHAQRVRGLPLTWVEEVEERGDQRRCRCPMLSTRPWSEPL